MVGCQEKGKRLGSICKNQKYVVVGNVQDVSKERYEKVVKNEEQKAWKRKEKGVEESWKDESEKEGGGEEVRMMETEEWKKREV